MLLVGQNGQQEDEILKREAEFLLSLHTGNPGLDCRIEHK